MNETKWQTGVEGDEMFEFVADRLSPRQWVFLSAAYVRKLWDLLPDGVLRAHRDMFDIEAPPFYKRTTGFKGNIDRWHTTNFTPPGFHVIENGSMPAGSKDRSAALERKVLNLITPETRTSSHYFWGVVRQFRLDDAELTEYIRDGIRRTFDQDKAVLEAQQRALGDDPDSAVFPVSIRVDAGPTQGRRLVQAMMTREGALTRDAEPGNATATKVIRPRSKQQQPLGVK